MPGRHRVGPTRTAFTLPEAAMIVLAVGVTLPVLLVAGAPARPAAGLSRDLGNLRQIGQFTFTYASDSEERAPTLTEAPGSQWPALLPVPGEPLPNAAKHAVDIIRRRGGREDFPAPVWGWLPNILYSHLPLIDYLDLKLPQRRWIASGDVHRMSWTDDPVNKHDLNFWQPHQQPPDGVPGKPVDDPDKRWPYSSSFNMSPAWYDAGQSDWSSGPPRMSQGSAFNAYVIPPGVRLEGARLTNVAFPSGKVLQHDFGDWYHAQTPRYFGRTFAPEAGARVAILLADGSAGPMASADANPGWDAQTPASTRADQYSYSPQPWHPPTSSGGPSDRIAAGVYRWTRGGVLGRDFDGAEIDTGQR